MFAKGTAVMWKKDECTKENELLIIKNHFWSFSGSEESLYYVVYRYAYDFSVLVRSSKLEEFYPYSCAMVDQLKGWLAKETLDDSGCGLVLVNDFLHFEKGTEVLEVEYWIDEFRGVLC